jgi:hypothetical protein
LASSVSKFFEVVTLVRPGALCLNFCTTFALLR